MDQLENKAFSSIKLRNGNPDINPKFPEPHATTGAWLDRDERPENYRPHREPLRQLTWNALIIKPLRLRRQMSAAKAAAMGGSTPRCCERVRDSEI